MDDCDFELKYLEGEKNIRADFFSRLPRMDKILMGDKELKMIQQQKGTMINFNKLILPQHDELLFTSTKEQKIGLSTMELQCRQRRHPCFCKHKP